jgi:hypothetical protein
MRNKKPVWEEILSPLKGIPLSLAKSFYNDQIVLGTNQGYIDLFDIRRRLFFKHFLLKKNNQILPVSSINNFVPTSKFKNMADSNTINKSNAEDILSQRKSYFLLSYPSNFNEFSIFSLDIAENEYKNPLLHFQAENPQLTNSSMRNEDIPYLQKIENNSFIDIDYKLNTKGLLLSQRLLNLHNVFYKNKAMYCDILKGNLDFLLSQSKLGLMQERLKHSTKPFTMENFHSVSSCLTFPQNCTGSNDIYFDNIIISAGNDRNIRFLNLGNEFKYNHPMTEDYKGLNCYLLSNSDYKSRSYFYHYTSDICLVRESFQKPKVNESVLDFDGFSEAFGFSNSDSRVYETGLNQAYLSQISNFN